MRRRATNGKGGRASPRAAACRRAPSRPRPACHSRKGLSRPLPRPPFVGGSSFCSTADRPQPPFSYFASRRDTEAQRRTTNLEGGRASPRAAFLNEFPAPPLPPSEPRQGFTIVAPGWRDSAYRGCAANRETNPVGGSQQRNCAFLHWSVGEPLRGSVPFAALPPVAARSRRNRGLPSATPDGVGPGASLTHPANRFIMPSSLAFYRLFSQISQ